MTTTDLEPVTSADADVVLTVDVPAGALFAALRAVEPMRKALHPAGAVLLDCSADGVAVVVTGLASFAAVGVDPADPGADLAVSLADPPALLAWLRHHKAGSAKGGAARVVLTVDPAARAVGVAVGAASTVVAAAPATVPELPELPEDLPATAWEVTAGELLAAWRSVAPARGTDPTLPVLTVVAFDVDPDRGAIALAATDRYRLAVRELVTVGRWALQRGDPGGRWLLPSWTGDVLARVPAGEVCSVGLVTDGRRRWLDVVAGDLARVVVECEEASFPAYRSLLPTDTACSLTVPRAQALADLKALTVERGEPVVVEPAAGDAGGYVMRTGTDRVERTTGDADEFDRVGFNRDFLADHLAAFPDLEDVTLRAAGPGRPWTTVHDGLTYLLMPVRVPEPTPAAIEGAS